MFNLYFISKKNVSSLSKIIIKRIYLNVFFSCENRKCEQPVLPLQSVCHFCGLDGWFAETNMSLIDRPIETNSLMECSSCQEITHPSCHTDYGVEGQISDITPNSWFCPKCMKFNPPSEDELAAKMRKVEEKPEFVVHGKSDQSKSELRNQLAEQIMSASTKPIKHPSYVFRPPPAILDAGQVYERLKKNGSESIKVEELVVLPVFQYLTTEEIIKCGLVCKVWHRISLDPSLWHTVNLTSKSLFLGDKKKTYTKILTLSFFTFFLRNRFFILTSMCCIKADLMTHYLYC